MSNQKQPEPVQKCITDSIMKRVMWCITHDRNFSECLTKQPEPAAVAGPRCPKCRRSDQMKWGTTRDAIWCDGCKSCFKLPNLSDFAQFFPAPSTTEDVRPLLHKTTDPLPDGCYCKPGQCMAPVIMGRQMACRDPKKASECGQYCGVDYFCKKPKGHTGSCNPLNTTTYSP